MLNSVELSHFQKRVTIGSDSSCDIVVPGLPEELGTLIWDDGCLEVIQSGPGFLLVGPKGPRTHLTINPGGRFRVGEIEFSVDEASVLTWTNPSQTIPRNPIAPSPTSFSSHRPTQTSNSLQLPPDGTGHPLTLGSHADCDLPVKGVLGLPEHAIKLLWDPTAPRGGLLTVIQDARAGRAPLVAGVWGNRTGVSIVPGNTFEIAGARFDLDVGGVLQWSYPAVVATPSSPPRVQPFEAGLVADRVRLPLPGSRQKTLDLNFRLPLGRLTVLIGPSGIGKSTLLRALLSARGGKSGFMFRGGNLESAGSFPKHAVSLVPQDPIFMPDLPVLDILHQAYWLKNKARGTRGGQRHLVIERALSSSSMTWASLKNDKGQLKYPSDFSGGQLKRLSVALELMTNPDILLLDEPNSGLDPSTDKAMMEELDRIAHSRIISNIIIVTHSLQHVPSDAHALALGTVHGQRRVVKDVDFARLHEELSVDGDAELLDVLSGDKRGGGA